MQPVCQAVNGFGCKGFGGTGGTRRLHLGADVQRAEACRLHGNADAMRRVRGCVESDEIRRSNASERLGWE